MNASSPTTAGPVLDQAARQPDAPALGDETGLRLTYGELAAAIRRTGDWLASLGLSAGDRIMVIGENSAALAVLLLAASHAGLRTVAENARRMPAEVAGILAHAMPRRVFVVHDQSDDAQAHADALGARPAQGPLPGRVSLAEPASPEHGDYAMPDDVALTIYTTGTTGQPKGVMLTHGGLCYIASMMARMRSIGPGDRVYGLLPVSHVMGHASVLLGSLHNGAYLHLASRFSPAQCTETLLREGITAVQGAPAMFSKLASHCRQAGIAGFPHVRFAAAGGAPIDATVKAEAQAMLGCALHNGYGLTEAASICWTRMDEPNPDDSVGRPLPGVEVAIRDPQGRDLPDGEVGELWTRGPNLMRGYFRNEALTRQAVDAQGWFNTQDLARRDPDGRLFIVGRTKDVIIRSGFNVYPLEVETVLNAHPDVLHSAVIGRPVPGNEEVVAYVELAKGSTARAPDLARHAAAALSPYKRPARIVIVPALPLAANGKVLKSQLAQRFAHLDSADNQGDPA